jgi:hypothetical protein
VTSSSWFGLYCSALNGVFFFVGSDWPDGRFHLPSVLLMRMFVIDVLIIGMMGLVVGMGMIMFGIAVPVLVGVYDDFSCTAAFFAVLRANLSGSFAFGTFFCHF